MPYLRTEKARACVPWPGTGTGDEKGLEREPCVPGAVAGGPMGGRIVETSVPAARIAIVTMSPRIRCCRPFPNARFAVEACERALPWAQVLARRSNLELRVRASCDDARRFAISESTRAAALGQVEEMTCALSSGSGSGVHAMGAWYQYCMFNSSNCPGLSHT